MAAGLPGCVQNVIFQQFRVCSCVLQDEPHGQVFAGFNVTVGSWLRTSTDVKKPSCILESSFCSILQQHPFYYSYESYFLFSQTRAKRVQTVVCLCKTLYLAP
jgi:hypothetical protein